MATYIIVPLACRGTHRQITGVPPTLTPSYTAIPRVCTCDGEATFRREATGAGNTTKGGHASVLQVDVCMCVASLCSKPAKNPTSTGSLSAGNSRIECIKVSALEPRKPRCGRYICEVASIFQ